MATARAPVIALFVLGLVVQCLAAPLSSSSAAIAAAAKQHADLHLYTHPVSTYLDPPATCSQEWHALLFDISLFTSLTNVKTSRDTLCHRFGLGGIVKNPKEVRSINGILRVTLYYLQGHGQDHSDDDRECFQLSLNTIYSNPTLRIKPGDRVIITLINTIPPAPESSRVYLPDGSICGASYVDDSSVNIHFHGLAIPPQCKQDDVLMTIVNGQQSFVYDFVIPENHQPGLYWYHPHVYGLSESALQGGASGAIIIEGLQNQVPQIAGLPEKMLIIRDLSREQAVDVDDARSPAWDLTVNNVQVYFNASSPTLYTKAPKMAVKANQRQFFRILNAAAGVILDITYSIDGVKQAMNLVAFDGVALPEAADQTSILIPPGSRAEVILTTPHVGANARINTQVVDTGVDGDADPRRPIVRLYAFEDVQIAPPVVSQSAVTQAPAVVDELATILSDTPAVTRHLYFYEIPNQFDNDTIFFVTVDGQEDKPFSIFDPPTLTATLGTVEDWIIENHSLETHDFHIHQIHFVPLEVDGVALPSNKQYFHDDYNVGPWDGESTSYPSIKLRMNFKDTSISGNTVYHCHIMEHEDKGMMAQFTLQLQQASSTSM